MMAFFLNPALPRILLRPMPSTQKQPVGAGFYSAHANNPRLALNPKDRPPNPKDRPRIQWAAPRIQWAEQSPAPTG